MTTPGKPVSRKPEIHDKNGHKLAYDPECEVCRESGKPGEMSEEMEAKLTEIANAIWQELGEGDELQYSDLERMGREAMRLQREQDAAVCVDMAERYDADIEGCDADELIEYGEGITCSFRLAYVIKYGTFPPDGDAWSVEFVEQLKAIRGGSRG